MLFRLLVFLVLFPIGVHAQDKVYLVGVEAVDYYPLFSFGEDSRNESSFARDLLTAFFTQHNLPFKLVPLPIKRFDRWYIEHGIDFKFPDNFRWRSDKYNKLNITFSEPIVKLTAGTYVNKEREELTRKEVESLGTIRGFHPSLWMKEIEQKQTTLVEVSTPLSVVKHLLANNVDATNIDSNVIRANLSLLGREGEIVLAKNIHHESFYYHFSSIRYPEIIALFDQFLLDNQDLINDIKEKYQIVE